MTVIYITENNCESYAVTFENKGWVKVQKFDDESLDENIIYTVNPMETFLGKSKSCSMTALSGAFNKACFDGNTILLKVGIENGKNKYVYIGGNMVCSFLTSDNIYEYISNMGRNLSPYSFAIGKENYYLLAPNFSFIKRIRLITILYWMEYTFQNLICLLKNWNSAKFIQIIITTTMTTTTTKSRLYSNFFECFFLYK